MNRSTTTVASIALGFALAYPAASWYLGKRIESIGKEQLHTQISALPYLKLVRNEYDRRLFNATQTVTLELPGALFMMPRMVTTGKNCEEGEAQLPDGMQTGQQKTTEPSEKPIQVTITTDIKHGPFPGFKALGAALAESRISFDAEMQKTVDAAFGGKPPLTMSTLFGFTGGGHGVMHLAAFHHREPKADGSGEYVFSGEALALEVDFSHDLKRYTITGKAPRFEVVDDAKLVVSGIALSGDQQRVFDDDPLLYAGKQRFSIEHIEFGSPDGSTPPMQMKNFAVEGEILAPGEFLDMIGKMGVEEFKLGEQNYGPAHYEFAFRHLNARKFSDFYRNSMALYEHLPADDTTLPPPEALHPIMASLQELTLDNAEFAIDRLSFNTPYGQTQVSAKIKLNDAVKEDWQTPLILIGKLDLTADLNVPEALLTALLAGKAQDKAAGQNAAARWQIMQKQLERFVAQGYITRTDGILKSKVEFRKGKLLCNDKPFNPFGSLPQ